MSGNETRIACRLSGELAEKYDAYKSDAGMPSDAAAIRRLLQIAFEKVERADADKLLHDVRATTSWGARFAAGCTVLGAMNASPDRAAYEHLSLNQRLELCMAAAGHLTAQRGKLDVERALAAGRRDVRRAHKKEGRGLLLEHMASLDSQAIFNVLDPEDLETWIVSMYAYRRGDEEEYGFDYEVGCQHLLSILDSMGVRTIPGAREKFNGSWVFSHEIGWKYLSVEAQEGFVPVTPSDYTDAFDPLDPHPENYSPTGIVAKHERMWTAHERE